MISKKIFAAFQKIFPKKEREIVDVSVIIPCHNYGRYLSRAIDSVLHQTVIPWEILVVDDASTDSTKDVALSYADRGVSYMRVNNRNLSLTRNSGARATAASFLLFLDADDYLQDDYIEQCLLQCADYRIGFAYGDIQKYGEETDCKRSPDFDPVLLSYSNYISSNALIRREAFDLVGGYRAIPHSLEDWDFYRRIVRANYIGKRAETKSFYFIHRDSMLQRHHSSPHCTYANSGALLHHPVTIFTVCTGNIASFSAYVAALRALNFDPSLVHLCWYNISEDTAIRALLQREIAKLSFRSVRLIHAADLKSSFTCTDRRPPENSDTRAILFAYNQIIRESHTDYVLTLGEGIVPSPDILSGLLRTMKEDSVAAIAPVWNSSSSQYEVWMTKEDGTIQHLKKQGNGTENVGGAGFGCTLFRMSTLRRISPLAVGHRSGETVPYDVCTFLRLAGYGYSLCNWDLAVKRIDATQSLA